MPTPLVSLASITNKFEHRLAIEKVLGHSTLEEVGQCS